MDIDTDEELYECPYCGSSNISCGHFDYESMSIEEMCYACERTWSTIFNIVGIYIPEEHDEEYKKHNNEFSYNDFHELKPGDDGYSKEEYNVAG